MSKIKAQATATDQTTQEHGDLDSAFISFVVRNSSKTPWIVVFIFALLAFIANQHLASPIALVWFITSTVFSIYRASVLSHLQVSSASKNRQVIKKIAFLSLFNGLLTGTYVLFFPQLTGAEQALATMFMISLCTGAVGTTTGQPKVFWLYTAPMLISLSIGWFITLNNEGAQWIDKAVSLLILLYGWLLNGLAQATYKSFCESHAIRYHERELNTQLKEAVSLAEEVSQSKTRFLASASHDLRQPIHAITLLIASLTLRPLDARSREIVHLLENANNSLSALFDSLLDISKLDAGLVIPERELISLTNLAAECFFSNQETIQKKGLKALLDVPKDTSIYIFTDRILILRIVQNLIDNAIKFTEAGSITVRVKLSDKQVHLSIQDTGIGIPIEHQSAIFQEYFQIQNEQRDRSKGLGLGLSIVQRLIAITGGRMSLESSPLGSCFSIAYPAVDPLLHQINQPAKSKKHPLQPSQFADLQILVVDDETAIRQSATALLEELGCNVVQASNTEEAVIQIQDWKPDLVLADFRLGNGDSGIRTIKAIRQVIPNVFSVIISGDTAPSRLKEAVDADLQLIHKPLHFDKLQELLNEANIKKKILQETLK